MQSTVTCRYFIVAVFVWVFAIQAIETKAKSPPDRGEALQIKKESSQSAPVVEPKAGPTPVNSERQAQSAQVSGEAVKSCSGTCGATPFPVPSSTEGSPKLGEPSIAKLDVVQIVHSIDENISGALESPYSAKLSLLIKRWPPENIEKKWEDNRPYWIRGIKNEKNSLYIGSEKQILIHANLKRVSALIQDFESYPAFYHDLKHVRVISKDGNKVTTFWERYSPVFFLANIKYEQVYVVDATDRRVTIRYQLKSANSINFADGLLVLEAEGENTRLTAFDFFDAKWGILGGIAPGKIWNQSFKNSVKDDMALKAHAEHPEWSRDQIFKESDRILDSFPPDPIQYVDPPNWASY
ncbi:MAG: hypothetical protein ABIQ95_05795 [Bdellovibrionia bacterium]